MIEQRVCANREDLPNDFIKGCQSLAAALQT